MLLFQTIQRGFALLGISSHQPMQKNPIINHKIAMTLLTYVLTIVSFNVYLFRVASTFWEYTINIYSNSATFLAVSWSLGLVKVSLSTVSKPLEQQASIQTKRCTVKYLTKHFRS